MKKFIYFIFLCSSFCTWSQRDSIPLGEKYREDQLYVALSYNQLFDQPRGVGSSGFSYGLNVGIMKDIPFTGEGNWALGIGLGYAFDRFNHKMQVYSANGIDDFTTKNPLESNIMSLHAVELPFELRWRNSNAQKYKFWRIYPGFKLSYNFSNQFKSVSQGVSNSVRNIDSFRNLQYGMTLSLGYDAFNLNIYYGLSSLFDSNANLENQSIETKIIRVGLIIYIL